MGTREIIGAIVLLVILTVAALSDWKYKKIPNGLVFPGMIAGIVITYTTPHSLLISIISLIAIFCIGMLDLMGLGDIKLWMVLTSFMGFIYGSVVMVLGMALMILDHLIRKRKLVTAAARNIVSRAVNGESVDKAAAGYKVALAPYLFFGYIIVEGWIILHAFVF